MEEKQLINELEDIVYISDPETNELIYVNEIGRKTMGFDDDGYIGQKCYKMIQDRDTPCEFCTNNRLKTNEFYIWEFTNPVLNRHYLLKDKFIEVDGRKMRFEIAVDISEKENVSMAVREKLAVEEALVGCIRRLTAAKSLDEAIGTVLEAVGHYYRADRSYIIEIDRDNDIAVNTYEWCQEGIAPQKEALQAIPMKDISFWLEEMSKKGCFAFEDVAEIKETAPVEYKILEPQGIKSLMVVPIGKQTHCFGYIGVDNPDMEKRGILLLRSLTYFIENEIGKRRNQMKLEYMSYHDALTGLANRYRYIEYLEALEKEPLDSIGIAFIDINGLKAINENYGHGYGDSVIIKTADILRNCLKSANIYRLSGDEFVIIEKDVTRNDFYERINGARSEFQKETISSVAIGCTWEDVDINIALLIQHANELMYVDKQEYYRQTVGTVTHHNPEILKGVLEALERQEFEMFLQAKGDVRELSLVGAEALVRHRHPEKGIIAPDKFIPLLERERIIKYIDLFIFEEVCKLLERWKKLGIPLITISLNFSRITMMEKNLIREMTRISDRYDFPRSFIEIEVTETMGEMERATVSEIGASIKALGFGISLDDFGTKYSSIAMLTIMDLDVIKLDRSLINTLVDNPKNRIIVRHIIDICHEMGAASIAEGVETAEQLEILRQLGCDWIQGYYLSKPVPVPDFETRFLFEQI